MSIIYIEEESYATEIGKVIKDTVNKLNSLYENLNIHILSHIKIIKVIFIKYLMRK